MSEFKSIGLFVLASMVISAVIYGSAMWGGRILAPLDIGPDLYKNYKYMDPKANGVPENHHIVDQFTYDLPLQFAIYRAYRAGEIPWWDPYTYGGRPLLADAHVNGTDPVRLCCYACLPFELAYNWNYIMRGILTGLGMFLLLRTLGVNPVFSCIFAITYQFAGWFTLRWGHPWIQGSFLYFPYLWIVWARAVRRFTWIDVGLGGLLCGLVFYAGNLQSHAYVILFAISHLGAVLLKEPGRLPRAMGVITASGIMGALLAAPVLFNQVEFFLLSSRALGTSTDYSWGRCLLSIPFSLGSYYPWMFGTFKTLDVGCFFKMQSMGFQLFCGIGCTCLALWGAWVMRRESGTAGLAVCQASLTVVIYLIVVATPLDALLYSRCSPLAGMGLIVLAALSAQAITAGKALPRQCLVKYSLGILLVTSMSTSALAWWLFPALKPRIEQKVLEVDKNDATRMSLPEYRKSQMASFSHEVSVFNPEVAATLVAAAVMGFALTRRDGKRLQAMLPLALVLSAMPVLIFHLRFRPSQPIALWHHLLEGGPAQHEASELLKGGLRLDESAMKDQDVVFPNAIAAIYRAHVVHGYSALQPVCLNTYPPKAAPVPADWRSDFSTAPAGNAELVPSFVKHGDSARFRLSSTGKPALVTIAGETHNRLLIDASSLSKGETLVRTDTYYPGWVERSADSNIKLAKIGVCFSAIPQPQAISNGVVELEYFPSYLPISFPCFALGILLVAIPMIGGGVSHAFRRLESDPRVSCPPPVPSPLS